MGVIKSVVTGIATTFATLIVHLGVVSFFPFPFNRANIIVLLLVWFSMYGRPTRSLGLAVALAFLIELYSSAPFGTELVALTGSVMALRWLLRRIFTNYSWYMVLLSVVSALIAYRLIFTFLIIGESLLSKDPWPVNTALFLNYALELLLTTAVAAVSYGLVSRVLKRLRPVYIQKHLAL